MTLLHFTRQLRKVAQSYGLLITQPSHNLGDLITALKVAEAENLIPLIFKLMREDDGITLSMWVQPFLDYLQRKADKEAANQLMEV